MHRLRQLRARVLAGIAAAAILAAVALWLTQMPTGAAVLASARCAGQLLKFDRASYQACFDVEREQILEDRARRHTHFDE